MNFYLAQIETRIFQWDFNLKEILNQYQNLHEFDAIFFPANALSGGPLHDLIRHPHFEKDLNATLKELTKNIKKPICFPQVLPKNNWKLIWIENQKIQYLSLDSLINFRGNKLFFFHPENELTHFSTQADYIFTYRQERFNYRATPPCKHAFLQETSSYIINIQSHSFDGANIFPGNSKIFYKNICIYSAPYFKNAVKSINKNDEVTLYTEKNRIALLHQGLLYAIKSYFQQKGFSKAFIASSGGLDSALVQTLVSQAIGGENTYAYLLPSDFSSSHSIEDAKKLSENLENPYSIISIKDSYASVLKSIEKDFQSQSFDFTEENIQARIRGLIMMALSNKNKGIVLNTSNKSEIAMGYSTMYGDAVGALSIIGDVYKSEAYALARYINEKETVIPEHILTKAPSAELRPDQKDTDSLPDYDLLDGILFKILEKEKSNVSDFNEAELSILDFVITKLHNNEFKRLQFPPIIKVSSCSFFEDRKYPSIF